MDNIARTNVWKGLNRAPFSQEGELRNMKNLSSDAFPYMTVRKPRKTYTFDVSVKGVAGDGYEADVAQLPEANENTEGKIYFLNPSYSGYEAGEYYCYKSGTWEKYSTVQLENRFDFYGAHNSFPETLNYEAYVGIKLFDDYDRAYSAVRKAESNNDRTVRNLSIGKDFIYKYTYYGVFREVEEEETYKPATLTEPEKLKNDPLNSKYVGRGYKYTGITTDELTNGKYYIFELALETKWEELGSQIYSAVTQMPAEPKENELVRFCGVAAPIKGNCYKTEKEILPSGEIFYFWNKTDEKASAQAAQLPPANETTDIVEYIGANEAAFYTCVRISEEEYVWQVTEQPYVTKNVTLKEYIEKYTNKFNFGEIIEIHAHDGEISALVKTSEGDVYLFVNKKFYKQPQINNIKGKTLVSCGRKLVVGGSGSYYDSKNNKYISGSGIFSYVLQCDVFSTFTEKEYITEAGTDYIKIYSEKEAELTAIKNTLDKEGTEFEMSSEKQKVKYPYKTQKINDDECCEIKEISWGKKLPSGVWVENKIYLLRIKIEKVEETFIRSFPDDEIYITSPERASEAAVWKLRLWSWNDNYLRGTIAGIFNDDMISWNEVNNNYNDSVSQAIWQGGAINAIIPLTDSIIIFKDDNISVFTGTTIATMTAYTIECAGLKKENCKSVAAANESVFYYSNGNVYRYAGGFPVNISEDVKFNGINAVGGTDGKKYYLSLSENGVRTLYVYDIEKRLWHIEDNINAVGFTTLNGNIYLTDGKEIFSYEETGENVEWEAEFFYDEDTIKKKKYKQFIFKGNIPECEVWLRVNDNQWAAAMLSEQTTIKIPPVICEKISIRLKGIGKMQIESIDRVFEIIE